jgi:hypothetical protein
MECFTQTQSAMSGELFFLRLETMLRASEEADRAKNYRFVPLSDNVFPTFREEQASLGASVCRRVSKSSSNRANSLLRLIMSSGSCRRSGLSREFLEEHKAAPAGPGKRFSTPNTLSLERPGVILRPTFPRLQPCGRIGVNFS